MVIRRNGKKVFHATVEKCYVADSQCSFYEKDLVISVKIGKNRMVTLTYALDSIDNEEFVQLSNLFPIWKMNEECYDIYDLVPFPKGTPVLLGSDKYESEFSLLPVDYEVPFNMKAYV